MTNPAAQLIAYIREPESPITIRSWCGYLCRLILFYAIVGLLGAAIGIVIMMGLALASPAPQPPDRPTAFGCAIILPDVDGSSSTYPLHARTLRPLSECDGSAPVAFGASIRDSGTGRAR